LFLTQPNQGHVLALPILSSANTQGGQKSFRIVINGGGVKVNRDWKLKNSLN